MSSPDQPSAESAACVSCATPLTGPYCAQCGEKRLDHHDYALAHYLEHAVDTFSHFDFKVLKGIRDLLFQPGRMTQDVLRGRRVPWPKPLQLFLIVNVLYAFLAHRVGMQVFNTPLRFHYSNWYGRLAGTMVADLARRRGTTLALLTAQFDHLADTLSKSLIVSFIPLLAALLALLLWRRHRYFLEHVVVATHLISQILLVSLVLIAPYALLYETARYLHYDLSYEVRDRLSSVLLLGLVTAWATPLLRRAYSLGLWPGVLAAASCAVGFMALLITIYRCLLFFITYWLL